MVFRWTGRSRGSGSRSAYLDAGEHTLVKGLRQGDDDAYAALFELYRARIFNFVARFVGDPEDAKDITQEVFVKAFRQIPGDGRELALKPWLYRVATTTCLDHLRARRRRGEPLQVSDELPATIDGFERAALTAQVADTLDRLSDRHRLVLVLKDLHGLHHDEIAEILGVSRGATETLLFRARAAFRQAFGAPAAEPPARRCPHTRASALAFIAGDATPDERARALEHARECRDCRVVVRRARASSVGLAAFVPILALPHALALPVGLAAGAGGGGAVAATAGTLAKIGATLSAKVATVAAAAAVTVAGAGIAVEEAGHTARGGHRPLVISQGQPAASPRPGMPGVRARGGETPVKVAHGSHTRSGQRSGDASKGHPVGPQAAGTDNGLALGRQGAQGTTGGTSGRTATQTGTAGNSGSSSGVATLTAGNQGNGLGGTTTTTAKPKQPPKPGGSRSHKGTGTKHRR